jgi:neutral amino acid transport system permease protein
VEVAALPRKRTARIIALLMAAVFACLAFSSASAASATETDTTEYDYIFSGNVKYESVALEGVVITVDGNGYEAEATTDAEGKWRIGVPEKETYTITLDESTLPDGVIVVEGEASIEGEFGLTNNKSVNFFLGEGVRNVTSFADQLVERIVNGLNFGLLLALAAIGASLVFGTTGLSNFAHGEMVTFGAIMALVFGVFMQFPLYIAIPIAVIVSAAFGLALDVVVFKPLRKRGIGLTQLLIVSIGLSLALRYIYQFFVGGNVYQLPGSSDAKIEIWGPIALTVTDMWSMGVSIIVIAAVAWWLLKTRIGKATRAISDNASLAASSGINVDNVVRIVWVISGALAGLSGILWALFIPGVKWDMGAQFLLLIFAAITLGGLGTAFGALIGSIIVGLLVEVSTLWIPSDLKYLGALVVLIGVLLFRPQGILGRRERIG